PALVDAERGNQIRPALTTVHTAEGAVGSRAGAKGCAVAAVGAVLDRDRRREAVAERSGVSGDPLRADIRPLLAELRVVRVAGVEVEERAGAAEGEAAELDVGLVEVDALATGGTGV